MRVSFALVLMFVFLVSASADAHCRKTTAGGDESYDASISGECAGNVDAFPLYWEEACLPLRVTVDPQLEASGTMTAERAKTLVGSASAQWSQVMCEGGQRVAIRVVDPASERCPAGSTAAPNELVFSTEPLEDGLLAVTEVKYDAVNGRVSGATTRLFDVYGVLQTPERAELDRRLERVVRHEIGHLLGLAHSNNGKAVMAASYDPTLSGSLTDDDIRGLCDAYGPATPVGAGCELARPAFRTTSGWSVPSIVLLLALIGARRSRTPRWRVIAMLAALIAWSGTVQAAAPPVARRSTTTASRASTKHAPSSAERIAEDVRLLRNDEPSLGGSMDASTPATASTLQGSKIQTVAPPAAAPAASDVAGERAAPASRPDRESTALALGYRVSILPRALAGLAAKTNDDIVFHAAAASVELRRSHVSVIPAVTFADLATGDMLVGSKSNDLTSSFSHVRSGLKAIAASTTVLWRMPVSSGTDLELGAELGIGFTFGPFIDDWVHETPSGTLSFDGRRFAPCRTVNDGFGCRPQDHASPTPVRLAGYRERSFMEGGRAPTILPWVSLPVFGTRVRLNESLAMRIGVGVSLTGLWAGVSLGYAVSRADR